MIKKIKYLLISIFIIILSSTSFVFASTLEEDAMSLIKDKYVSDINNIPLEKPDLKIINDRYILIYKFWAATVNNNNGYRYRTVGFVIHDKKTGETREKLGVYENISYKTIYFEGKNTNVVNDDGYYTWNTGIQQGGMTLWVNVIDVTEYYKDYVNIGADKFYVSAILGKVDNGKLVDSGYLSFNEFLISSSMGRSGEDRFKDPNGEKTVVGIAIDGYYNKEIEIPKKKINITMFWQDENGEILQTETYNNVEEQNSYIYELTKNFNDIPYVFVSSHYKKVGQPGDYNYDVEDKNENIQILPENLTEDYDLEIYGVYKKVSQVNMHYVLEGRDYNDEANRLIDSNEKFLKVGQKANYYVWSEINNSDKLKGVFPISNIKIYDKDGNEIYNIRKENEKEEYEGNWKYLMDILVKAIEGLEKINVDITNDGNGTPCLEIDVKDYINIDIVVEYAFNPNNVFDTVPVYVYYIEQKADGTVDLSNLENNPSYEGGVIGNYAKNTAISVNLDATFNNKLLKKSYIIEEDITNTPQYFVDSTYKTRKPIVGNEPLYIIAEYGFESEGGTVPVYVYYIEQRADGTVDLSNLENNPSYKGDFIGNYAKNTAISVNLDATFNNKLLKKSYIIEGNIATGEKQFEGDNTYTRRNPIVGTEELYIIAEYGIDGYAENGVKAWVYYIKQKSDGTVDLVELTNNPAFESYNFGDKIFYYGDTVTTQLPLEYTNDSEYKLIKSYITSGSPNGTKAFVSARDTSQNTGGVEKFVTTRNVKVYYDDVYIIAEYAKIENEEIPNYEWFEMKDMNANGRGLIASEDDQYYNVYRGIPSGCNVYTQFKANSFLYSLGGFKVTGSKTYIANIKATVKYKYDCSGDCCPGHTEVVDGVSITNKCGECCKGPHEEYKTITNRVDITRNYEFYTIDNYKIYNLNSAKIYNEITGELNKTFNNSLKIDSEIKKEFEKYINEDAIKALIDDKEWNLGCLNEDSPVKEEEYDEDEWENEAATKAINDLPEIMVKNDYLKVNDKVIIDGGNDEKYSEVTKPDYGLQVENKHKDLVETWKDINIPVATTNGAYRTTESYLIYNLIEDTQKKQEGVQEAIFKPIKGFKEKNSINDKIDIDNDELNNDKINDVAVHTPVYINMTINQMDINKDNQSIDYNIAEDLATVVLDKSFEIKFDVKGRNRNIRKYRDENEIYTEKWLKDVPEIKFPFDVYVKIGENENGDTTVLCKANTWYKVTDFKCGYDKIGDEGGKIKVIIPLWTEEKMYDEGIVMRVVAHNDIGTNESAIGAFEEGNWNGSKTDNSSVEGKVIYTDSPSYSRTCDKLSLNVTGRVYDFKLTYTDDSNYRNVFGDTFDIRKINKLPFGQKGDNLSNKYVTALRLGSKIRYDLKTKGKASDTIKIVPTFYWVSKKGGELTKVDAYYLQNGQRVKLSESTGLIQKITVQNFAEIPETNKQLLIDEIEFSKSIGRNYNYGISTNIGKTGKILLGPSVRLTSNILTDYYVKNTYGFNQTSDQVEIHAGGLNNILNSYSHWYGEFTLPQNTWFVADGNQNNAIKEEGYVIVYFKIETLKGNEEYLSYQLPKNNTQWVKEGWQANKIINLPNGKTVKDRNTSTDYVGIAIYDANVNKDGSRVIVTH